MPSEGEGRRFESFRVRQLNQTVSHLTEQAPDGSSNRIATSRQPFWGIVIGSKLAYPRVVGLGREFTGRIGLMPNVIGGTIVHDHHADGRHHQDERFRT
jgi:hypothetical protein